MALKTILFALAYGGGLLYSLITPLCGLVIYILVYHVMPNDRWWGMPIAAMGVRFSMLAGLFMVLGLVVSPHRVPKAGPSLTAWEICAIVMVVIALLNTYFFGLPPDASSATSAEKFWKMLLVVLIMCRLGSTRANFKVILWTFAISTLWLGWDAHTAPAGMFVFGRLEGIGGPDFNTTSGFSAHMTSMLPLLGVLALIAKNWKWRLLAAASGAFTVNAIIMCRTRSAFIGMAMGVVVALLMAPRSRRLRIYAALGLGLVLAFQLTDDHFWVRMNTMSDPHLTETDLATAQRLEIWEASKGMIADHPFGIGLANFPQLIGQYEPRFHKRSTHNTLIVCFVEFGIPGGLIFLTMTGLALASLRRTARLADQTENPLETKLLAYGALVSFVTYFVTGLGTERLYCESFWWIMALPVCLERLTKCEAQQRLPALETTEQPAATDPLWSIPYDGSYCPPGHYAPS